MKEKWVKPWEREYSLHRMSQVMEGLMSDYAQQVMGFCVTRQMALRMPNGNDASFFDTRDWEKFHAYVRRIFYDHRRFNIFQHTYIASKKEFVGVALICGQQATLTAEPRKLLQLFTKFTTAHDRYMLIGQYTAFYLTELSDRMATQLVQHRAHGRQIEHLQAILSPEYMSEIRKERVNLLHIALEKNKARRERMLVDHTKRFQWIPCINVFNPPPWNREFFARELKRVIRTGKAAGELRRIKQIFAKIKSAFQKLRKDYSKKDRELLDRAHLLAFIKDDRDDARRKAYFYARPLYTAISRALKLTPAELFRLTADEILTALRTGKTPTKAELKARERGYGLVIVGGKIRVKTGGEYRKLLTKVTKGERKQSVIQGIAAAGGTVRGSVKVAANVFSLGKIKKGDILVTVATHPDYLPAMRLAKAIVTDEGGMTSHAAIVSRELGIPCIVGTKFATKVFKDGDMVEVDANKGIVKILKKAGR